MKTPNILISFIAVLATCFASCGKNQSNTSCDTSTQNDSTWVQEMTQRNPFANDTGYTSVYFKFDTIVNGYNVSGIYFPTYHEENKNDRFHGWFYESGVIMYFRNITTGKEYKFTDFDERCKSFKNIFMSKNVYDINTSEDFKGYKSGDAYIFQYHDKNDAIDAEFLFRDIDLDGEDELLIGYYQGGPHQCNAYDILEITDTKLVDTKIMLDEYELLAIMKNHLCVSGLSSNNQSPFPQITAFTDYVYNDFHVFTFSDTIGILQQLDIEFPTGMKDKKVLAKIQEQLIDTILHTHYQTTQLDEAMAKYWRIEPNDIELKSVYPLIVPNDSDEYFNYGGVQSRQFEHLCGRTSYNQNGLYIMRHHYTWYGGGCHNFPDTQYFAFDTRTGEMVHFMDIFSEDYEDTERQMIYDISYYVQRALLDKYPKISLQYWIQASFTLTPTSLVLHYTHYTLGCFADGEQEVEIPLEKAKLFLNPRWKHLIQ
jgi:hypothetical protein